MKEDAKPETTGPLCIFLAFLFWGVSSLYWKAIDDISPYEIVLHRIIWSSVTLIAALFLLGRIRDLVRALRDRKVILLCGCTAFLISINWLLFIYSITSGQLTEASLGYYICPIMTVLLGALCLGERLTSRQKAAVLVSCAAVGLKLFHTGKFPWLGIIVAASFAVYALLRKRMSLDGIMGLAVETVILSVPALAIVVMLELEGESALFHIDRFHDSFLILSGVVTMIPLLLYAIGVRRTPLSLAGFLQYIAPTMQLGIAVFIFHEPFERFTFIIFLLVWTALALFLSDSFQEAVIET